jgi:hypothetical protein
MRKQQPKQEETFNRTPDKSLGLGLGLEAKRRRLIFLVTEGPMSPQTASKYRVNFNRFLDYIKIHDLDVLLDLGKEAIQELVMKYTLSLRDNSEKKYARGTVNNRIAPILYFLDNRH